MPFLGYMLFICTLLSCASHPYRLSNKTYKKKVQALSQSLRTQPNPSIQGNNVKEPEYWVGTVNFGLRKPNYVVIHHTGQQSCNQTLQTFAVEKTQVSAHYLICADGTLHQLLHDQLRAWHAGASKWGTLTDLNSVSIGIELDNDGVAPYAEEQFQVLLVLLDSLKQRYKIPTSNFIGHADIAPSRKVDPGVNFSWERLAKKGFGLWYADTTHTVLPENFDPFVALKIIGYDLANPDAAVHAFRLHFVPSSATGDLLLSEKKILYSLLQKLMSQ